MVHVGQGASMVGCQGDGVKETHGVGGALRLECLEQGGCSSRALGCMGVGVHGHGLHEVRGAWGWGAWRQAASRLRCVVKGT